VGTEVEGRLRTFLAEEKERWTAFDPELAAPIEALTQLVLAGAKRLRPAFCHWGFVAAGGSPADPVVVEAGAAFELLQAFALIHDDVMDGSSIRRGRRTAHLEFAGRHALDGWRGEARRFGEGMAILIGDLAFVYADQLMSATESPQALDVWNELRIELNVGQLLDMVGTARGDTDPLAARRIARYKSGKYTIERPLHVGAALAGGLDRVGPVLSAYGDPLGEAFQLRDDLLGAFGDPELTGKPVGEDLREGKPTPLLAIAVERWPAGARSALERIGAPDLSETEVRGLQQVLVDTGAQAEVEATIDDLAEQAVAALAGDELPQHVREALTDLAWFVAHRPW
jgi:geranylgeranyl diphosphate synthase type I